MTTSTLKPGLTLNEEKILAILKSGGLLSERLNGFEPREAQQKMAMDVIRAYNDNNIALIEAGTGTGKSIAYLLPALVAAVRHQERTVISTNTITLQEQLINKDIPALAAALNITVKAVLVKGMNNYVCLRKLEDAQSELRLYPQEEMAELDAISAWKRITIDGSRSSLPMAPSQITWERVGAESDSCSHNECPHYQECFFFRARRQANDANILVANHSLLFADLHRRAETNNYDTACILPSYQRLVLDEAHHIEDVATDYFATRADRLDLMRLLGRLSSEKQNKTFGKLPLLKEKIQTAFQNTPPTNLLNSLTSLTIDLPAMRRQIQDQIHECFHAVALFAESQSPMAKDDGVLGDIKLRLLADHCKHFSWNDEVVAQVRQLTDTLKKYIQGLISLEGSLKRVDHDKFHEQSKGVRFEIQALAMRLEGTVKFLSDFMTMPHDHNSVRWIETQKLRFTTNVHLVEARLNIAPALVEALFSKFSTVILCSATLTTNRSFAFIRQRLGLISELIADRSVTESVYESPFDYQKQTLLAVPTDLPSPIHPDFNKAAVEKIWDAIHVSRGNTFVLFTSYTMLQECYGALLDRMKEHKYHPLKQGDGQRHELLNKFKTTNYSVLFGTDSFWEGVDVSGDALRCVVIVKLPFKVPSEPIIQARTESLVKEGKDPFMDYSLPSAIVKFKQGFGRLIRNRRDRGCIVCLDTRLITKGYGRMFLNSLPPCDQVVAESAQIQERMRDFYRKTHHLTKDPKGL